MSNHIGDFTVCQISADIVVYKVSRRGRGYRKLLVFLLGRRSKDLNLFETEHIIHVAAGSRKYNPPYYIKAS